ncbi:MAG: hypothetical protein AAF492_04500, partial [Verrucomicrobiota bacterium]
MLLITPISWGGIMFQDDFNAYPPGAYPGNLPWNLLELEDSNRVVEVLGDTGNLFGEGISNRYLRIFDGDPRPTPPGSAIGV